MATEVTKWRFPDGVVWQGDVLATLPKIPDRSVHCVVTSPPYWNLRDYMTGTWEGGDSACDHVKKAAAISSKSTLGILPDGTGKVCGPNNSARRVDVIQYEKVCKKCGAVRTDSQIGCEDTPQEYVDKLVLVFREVRRILRDDGVLWLNLGDSYVTSPKGNVGKDSFSERPWESKKSAYDKRDAFGLRSGNLVGIPWRVAFALQADGWVLRQDIIWRKKSPMPESVRNRCTKAHEYVFLLTKKMRYYYDREAVRENAKSKPHRPANNKLDSSRNDHDRMDKVWGADGTSNKRSVWTVDDHCSLLDWLAVNHPDQLREFLSQSMNKPDVWSLSSGGSFRGDAHFATFPESLVTPCILAGTSEKGCCPKCAAPWKRVVAEMQLKRDRPNDFTKRTGARGTGNSCANTVAGVAARTLGWYPSCSCEGLPKMPDPPPAGSGYAGTDKKTGVHSRGRRDDKDRLDRVTDDPDYELWLEEVNRLLPLAKGVPTVPCVVMDPFAGSGTTLAVAVRYGRKFVGCELNPKYVKFIHRRVRRGELKRGLAL